MTVRLDAWWERSRHWPLRRHMAMAAAVVAGSVVLIGPRAAEPAVHPSPGPAATVAVSTPEAAVPTAPIPPAPPSGPDPPSAPPPTTVVAAPAPADVPSSAAAPVPSRPASVAGVLPVLVVREPTPVPAYSRDLFGGAWIDADGDCEDTRAEVLAAESEVVVTVDDGGCRVVAGRWTDPWSGHQLVDASTVDVDHMVPLADAWRSGAWAWSGPQRIAYANDLTDPGHLVSVSAALNRGKGDSHPAEWRPPDPATWCEYALTWSRIKARWNLTVTPEELAALGEMAARC